MKKTELIAEISAKTSLTKKDSEKALNAAIEAVSAALANGEKVSIAGFGTFEAKVRPARVGRNPKTLEAIEIAASRVPAFKAGKTLKDKVAY